MKSIFKNLFNWFKKSKIPFVFLIISIIIFVILLPSVILIGNLKQFLIYLFWTILPAIIYLKLVIEDNAHKKEGVSLITAGISILVLPIYYLVILVLIVLNINYYPVQHPLKYKLIYNMYNNEVKEIFPSTIPDSASNIRIIYHPKLLQGGEKFSLYFIDDDQNINEYIKIYEKRAIWIGSINDDYDDSKISLPSYLNNNDEIEDENFTIYLISNRCDDSDYCNHGRYLVVAINNDTNEIVFEIEHW